jgi:hypothetical protein
MLQNFPFLRIQNVDEPISSNGFGSFMMFLGRTHKQVWFFSTIKFCPSCTLPAPFLDPSCTSDKALYMFIASWSERYFQWLIRAREGLGDAALQILQ